MPTRGHRAGGAALRLLAASGAALALVLAGCGDEERAPSAQAPETTPATTPSPTPTASPEATPSPSPSSDELARADGAHEVETVATGLEVPWDMAFLPGGSALVTERGGAIRLLRADGSLRESPVARVEVSAVGEGGLLGIALDPRFKRARRFAYLYVTTAQGMEVQRWRVGEDASLERDGVVLDGVRAGVNHDSGRLRFGPEGDLYVATGDAGRPELAQDPAALNGKILRLTPDQYRSSSDDPEILSLGHRNPQGLSWQPGSGRLFATEHGNQSNDEINVIREGRNYGWPIVEGRQHGDFEAPAMVYPGTTLAPSGATFVSLPGSTWTGDLLVATLRGRQLRRLSFDGTTVTEDEALLRDEYGRLRAAVEGADGAIYVLTSNRDGRGDPGPRDDRILRIVPPAD